MVKTKSCLSLVFKIVLFCIAIYFPLFLHLDVLPLRLFDESRLAMNAAAMIMNNNWLVTYYQDNPDMWSTKPPLLIWIQALLFKLIGPTELALRLPSAIAATLTCFSLLVFSLKHLKSYWFGFITSIILVTSSGYVGMHGTRTGDYDALLTLFITLFALAAFSYSQNRSRWNLFCFFLFFSLAALTKGVQSVIILPAIFLYILATTWRKITWSDGAAIAIGGLLSILAIGSYYLLREQANPGYLLAVWQNELGGRYMEVNENNTGGFFFYLQNITNRHFSSWYWLVPIGFVVGLFSSQNALRKLTLFSAGIALWYWLVISTSQTKLFWYALPLYPFLSVIAAVPIFSVFEMIRKSASIQKPVTKGIALTVFMLAVYSGPYAKTIKRTYFLHEHPWDIGPYSIYYYLKQPITESFNPNGETICYDYYIAPLEFYQFALSQRGIAINLIGPKEIKIGDTLLVYQPEVMKHIESSYKTESSVVFGKSVMKYIIKAEN